LKPGSPARAAVAGPIRSALFAEGMGERAGVGSDESCIQAAATAIVDYLLLPTAFLP